ncbi:transmembrane protein 223 [Exaiptasia diaphana]|uniref:Transmembrane protein 223 n=1 Tax=Exaiptasia diaphana TaxID=2652724 RepID=A0A913WQT6_EXADI|nr:transmembrane protein 223 [Exaiptasia diaphana]KXJ18692.1 Transmembrane protein 223 [Exaiptasia diaphana]
MSLPFSRNIARCKLFFRVKQIFANATEVAIRARTTISKDATLYYYDRRKFFRLVGLASCSQSVFWIYLAYFQYTTRPQIMAGMAEREKMMSSERSESKIWKVVQLIEQSPVFLSVFAVSVGMFLSATGWIYCLRNVNSIVLTKGGEMLKITTHTPLGGTRSITTPIRHVSSIASRLDNKSQIPFKIKGHKFFFIIDKEGQFLQPTLFDNTVCVNRHL